MFVFRLSCCSATDINYHSKRLWGNYPGGIFTGHRRLAGIYFQNIALHDSPAAMTLTHPSAGNDSDRSAQTFSDLQLTVRERSKAVRALNASSAATTLTHLCCQRLSDDRISQTFSGPTTNCPWKKSKAVRVVFCLMPSRVRYASVVAGDIVKAKHAYKRSHLLSRCAACILILPASVVAAIPRRPSAQFIYQWRPVV